MRVIPAVSLIINLARASMSNLKSVWYTDLRAVPTLTAECPKFNGLASSTVCLRVQLLEMYTADDPSIELPQLSE